MMGTAQTGILWRVAAARMPTRWGMFEAIGYAREVSNGSQRIETALAIVMGDLTQDAPLLRLHSQCFTGEQSRQGPSLGGCRYRGCRRSPPVRRSQPGTRCPTCAPKRKGWGRCRACGSTQALTRRMAPRPVRSGKPKHGRSGNDMLHLRGGDQTQGPIAWQARGIEVQL
jgi:hypothetical protein